jgi:TRAP-type mannitol/chloroaromatic compound transport system permease small subunit
MNQPASGQAPTEATRPLDKLLRIERINTWTAAISSWSLLAMTLFVAFEVVSRYVFNKPTIWAWDVNVQLMLLLLMMGISEAYKRDAHVRVDVITGLLSERQNAWINVAMSPVFFFITVVLVVTCWLYFLDSYQRGEEASTLFAPPLWPIKFFMPLGSALLLLQGLVNLIRDLRVALGFETHPTRGES